MPKAKTMRDVARQTLVEVMTGKKTADPTVVHAAISALAAPVIKGE